MVFLNGAKENKKKFIDSLKDDKRIIKSKASGSQIFVLIEGEDHIAPLMPKEIFFLRENKDTPCIFCSSIKIFPS